MTTTLTLH